MGLEEKKKREHLINIIQKYLETSKCLMEYYKAVATTRKGKLACTRSIKKIDQATAKGVLKMNTAARRKSRIAGILNKIGA